MKKHKVNLPTSTAAFKVTFERLYLDSPSEYLPRKEEKRGQNQKERNGCRIMLAFRI